MNAVNRQEIEYQFATVDVIRARIMCSVPQCTLSRSGKNKRRRSHTNYSGRLAVFSFHRMVCEYIQGVRKRRNRVGVFRRPMETETE